MNILIDLQYLPPLSYFCALFNMKSIIIEQYEHYVKQSYRNRCYINTANGILKLIIPIVRKPGKMPIKEVKIAHATEWQKLHWRALESAYRKAPFFDHYADKLKPILFHNHLYLYDLNRELLSFCLDSLNLSIPIVETHAYGNIGQNSEIEDLRSIIHPKKHDSAKLFYTPIVYFQIFGNNFASNLSIIDLLFCKGPEAATVIQHSAIGQGQAKNKAKS